MSISMTDANAVAGGGPNGRPADTDIDPDSSVFDATTLLALRTRTQRPRHDERWSSPFVGMAVSVFLTVLGSAALVIASTQAGHSAVPARYTPWPDQFCDIVPSMCLPTAPATAPLAMARTIIDINRYVNKDLVASERGQGVSGIVAPGGRANCIGFARTKRLRLLQAQVPAGAMRMAEVRLRATGKQHVVLLVKIGPFWYALDNLTDIVWPTDQLDAKFEWIAVEEVGHPSTWTHERPVP